MAQTEPQGSVSVPMDEEDAQNAMFEMVSQVAKKVEEAPRFAKKAWFCLDKDSFPRKQCIAVVSNKWFDRIILTLIGVNCLTMLWFNEPALQEMIDYYPTDFDTRSTWAANHMKASAFRPLAGCTDPKTHRGPCNASDWVDWVFLLFFAIEMVLKATAMGFIQHPHAYLRSGWNWLDFIVVIVGYIEMYLPGVPAVTMLRPIKTLRPLRSLQRVRGMRVLVQCIMVALPQMCNVLLFLFFIIFFFALFGVALFKSGLRYTCHKLDGGAWSSTGATCHPGCTWDDSTMRLKNKPWEFSPPGETYCTSFGNNTLQHENYAEGHLAAHWTYSCRAGEECRCSWNGEADPTCDFRANPAHGITSFDSLPFAMVSLFQAISLEGWVDMMYALMDGVSSWVWIYFVLLVLFGAIIVINLFLAVLCDNFDMANEEDEEGEEEVPEDEALENAMNAMEHKNGARQAVLNLIKHKFFDIFIQACIILNTVLMCVKWAPQPNDMAFKVYDPLTLDTSMMTGRTNLENYMPAAVSNFADIANITLTSIFLCESILKIIGLGFMLFASSKMNIFDAVVVALSILEIALDKAKVESALLPLSVLRAFRIFRLFKLVKSVPSIARIFQTLLDSMVSAVYLGLLLILMCVIFILLGMELFGGFYPRPELNYTDTHFPKVWQSGGGDVTWTDDYSRYHFDDVGNAFVVIFVVLSGENWNEIMFDTHTASFDTNMNTFPPFPYAIVYFMLLFMIGNLLLFNLFIAILLSNFDEPDAEPEEEDLEPDGIKRETEKDERTFQWRFDGYVTDTNAEPGSDLKATATRKSATGAPMDEDGDDKKKIEHYPVLGAEDGGDKALMLFSWSNPLRRALAALVSHWLFESIIVLFIVISTCLMLADAPHLPKTHPLRNVISYFNFFFAIVFLVEMLLKWVTTGIFYSKTPKKYTLATPYFKSGWNWLDFVIVVISMISLSTFEGVDPLRALRAARPLRLISRYEDLKIVVETLFKSALEMVSLMSVTALFFIIFAILGLELFAGKLGYCMDPLYGDAPYGSRVIPGLTNASQTDYEECMLLPRYNLTRRTTNGILFSDMADLYPGADPNWLSFSEFPQWLYPHFGHFDNFMLSLALLFEISALEGWPDVMHMCMDTDQKYLFIVPWKVSSNQDGGLGGVGVPMDSHTAQTTVTAIFFVLWIIIGCFVVVNMTVGVVVDTFGQIKQANDGLILMTPESQDWVTTQKQVFAQRPLVQASPPKQAWRMNVYYLVVSTKFEVTIMVLITLNMVAMGCDWWEPSMREANDPPTPNFVGAPTVMQDLKSAHSVINIVFLVVYIIEMVLKWIGLGFKQYFTNPWDFFDCTLVCVSAFEAIVSAMNTGSGSGFPFPPSVIRVLRLFRVIRLLRVIKTAKSLRTIIMTVVISIPQLKNIMVLILLIFSVVNVLCINRFFAVNYTPGNHDPWYDHAHSTARGEVLPQPGSYYYADDNTNWGDQINRHANFQFFWTGFLLLTRASTGESFNGIMHDLYDYKWGHNRLTCCPQCGPMIEGSLTTYILPSSNKTVETIQPVNSCGSTFWAVIIYFSFQLIMAYVVLSIMIGVILENFSNVGSDGNAVSMEDIEEFREVWLKYDPQGTFVVPSHNLLAILQQLPRPLGIAPAKKPGHVAVPALTRAEMLKHLGQLDIPDRGGYIHFTETLTALSWGEANRRVSNDLKIEVNQTTMKLQKAAQQAPKLKAMEQPVHNALTNYLVSLLQSRWRGYAMRAKYEGDVEPPASSPQPKVKASQVAPDPAP